MTENTHQGVEKTEFEKIAVAEKKEWLKEEAESDTLLVSITVPQVICKSMKALIYVACHFSRSSLWGWLT